MKRHVSLRKSKEKLENVCAVAKFLLVISEFSYLQLTFQQYDSYQTNYFLSFFSLKPKFSLQLNSIQSSSIVYAKMQTNIFYSFCVGGGGGGYSDISK